MTASHLPHPIEAVKQIIHCLHGLAGDWVISPTGWGMRMIKSAQPQSPNPQNCVSIEKTLSKFTKSGPGVRSICVPAPSWSNTGIVHQIPAIASITASGKGTKRYLGRDRHLSTLISGTCILGHVTGMQGHGAGEFKSQNRLRLIFYRQPRQFPQSSRALEI